VPGQSVITRKIAVAEGVYAPGHLGELTQILDFDLVDAVAQETGTVHHQPRPIGGQPTITDEADGVRFVRPEDLDQYDIHPSMRQQIGDHLAGTYPYVG
jgi:hypothetical protein